MNWAEIDNVSIETADIGDLTVTTGKIAANAVFDNDFANVDESYSNGDGTPNNTWFNVDTLTVDSLSGHPVFFSWDIALSATSSADGVAGVDMDVRILRNGSVHFGPWSISAPNGGSDSTSDDKFLQDAVPSAGTYTYIVTGQGTAWSTAGIKAGDFFVGNDGRLVPISSVDSNTAITLIKNWPGTTQAGTAYQIVEASAGARIVATTQALLEKLSGGNVTAFSGLVGAADKLPYFTGAGQMALASLTSFGRSLTGAADAAAGRTALALGTAATKNTGTSGNNIPLLDGANTWSGQQTLSAPVLFPAGSEALPGISFSGDPDTGWRRPAANTIGEVTGGVTRRTVNSVGTQLFTLDQTNGARHEVRKISAGSQLNYSATTAASVVQSELLVDRGVNGTYPIGEIIYADKNCDGNVSVSPDQSHSAFPVLRVAGVNEGDGSMPAVNTQVTLEAVGAVGYNEAALYSGTSLNAASINGNISACELLIGDSNDGGTTNFDTILTNFLARSKRYNAGSEACILYKWSIEGDEPADAVLKGLAGEIKTFADLRNQVITTGQVLQLPNDVAFAAENSSGALTEFMEVNSVNQTILRSVGGNASLRLQDGTGSNQIEINNAKLGFFGATPVAKPTGVAVSAAGIHAALVSLGLIAA